MPRIMLAPMPGASLREQLREMGKMVAQAARENRDNTVYWIAYMLHVLGDSELKRRAAVQGRGMRKQVAKQWSKVLRVDELPMPIETLVKVLTTLTNSMIIAHSMTPEDFDEAVIVAAFEAFAGQRVAAATKKRKRR
jgi:dipeptidase